MVKKSSPLRPWQQMFIATGFEIEIPGLTYVNPGIDLHQSIRHYAADPASKLLNS
jgi:hypothetical protein